MYDVATYHIHIYMYVAIHSSYIAIPVIYLTSKNSAMFFLDSPLSLAMLKVNNKFLFGSVL